MRTRAAGLLCADIASFTPDFDLLADFDFPAILIDNYEVVESWVVVLFLKLLTLYYSKPFKSIFLCVSSFVYYFLFIFYKGKMSLTINFVLNTTSTFTFRGVTLTANGGANGTQNGTGGAGGTASGGYNVSGGNGQYASGDVGGGGGGGINGGIVTYSNSVSTGGTGGSSSDFRSLQAALTVLGASYILGPGGNGGAAGGSASIDNNDGGSASSLGAGGGGAGYYGGAGGNGYLGGGGGGAASYHNNSNTGGNGGGACVIIRYKSITNTIGVEIFYNPSTSYTLPSNTETLNVWLIGPGGKGGNTSAGDDNAGSGGGAGGMAYYEWTLRQAASVLVSGAANKTVVNKYLLNSSIDFGPFTTTNTDGNYTVTHTSLDTSIVTIPSFSVATATIKGPGSVVIKTEFSETANFYASSGNYVTIVIIGPNTTYTNSNLANVDLTGSDVTGSIFSNCNLQNANLFSATVNATTNFETVTNMQNLRSGRIYGITSLFPPGYKLI